MVTFEYLRECDILSYFVKTDGKPFTNFSVGHNYDVTPVNFDDPVTLSPKFLISTSRVSPSETGGRVGVSRLWGEEESDIGGSLLSVSVSGSDWSTGVEIVATLYVSPLWMFFLAHLSLWTSIV